MKLKIGILSVGLTLLICSSSFSGGPPVLNKETFVTSMSPLQCHETAFKALKDLNFWITYHLPCDDNTFYVSSGPFTEAIYNQAYSMRIECPKEKGGIGEIIFSGPDIATIVKLKEKILNYY